MKPRSSWIICLGAGFIPLVVAAITYLFCLDYVKKSTDVSIGSIPVYYSFFAFEITGVVILIFMFLISIIRGRFIIVLGYVVGVLLSISFIYLYTHVIQVYEKAEEKYIHDERIQLSSDLLSAIKNGNYTKAEELLKSGAFINALFPDINTDALDKDMKLFIINKCLDRNGDTFFNKFIDSLQPDSDVETILGYIIRMGVDPNRPSPENTIAYSDDLSDIICNSKPYDNPMKHALMLPDKALRQKAVKALLDNGVNVNVKTGELGETPIMHAVENNDNDLAQFLLSRGANITMKDEYEGNSLLWYAVRGLNLEAAKYLISHKADVNERNKNGETPLWGILCWDGTRAVDNKDRIRDIVELLHSKGADIDLPDNHNKTLYLRLKESSDNPELIEILKKCGTSL